MAALPSLKGLQAFEAAARSGSFAAAAEELSISAAAVSQLIRTVEEQMGRKLFHRVNRRVVLTEAGVEMLPRLTLAFQEIGSIARGGDAFRPRLVISVPPSMAMGWLSERLAGFGWSVAIDSRFPLALTLAALMFGLAVSNWPGVGAGFCLTTWRSKRAASRHVASMPTRYTIT